MNENEQLHYHSRKLITWRNHLSTTYLKLIKQATKSGWTYVVIDAAYRPGETVCVSGSVNGYLLHQFNLLPMKDGNMLLPVKAALRKAIQKKAGDTVNIILYADLSPVALPEYIQHALPDSPEAHAFLTLSGINKQYYIDWIDESKKIDTKVARIVKTIKQLDNKKKFWDWPVQKELL